MTIDLTLLMSLLSVVMTIASFFIGRFTASRKQGQESGQLLSDIGYIKRGMDDLKSEIKEERNHTEKMQFSIAEHGRDIKSAFERIKKLEESVSRYHEHGGSI
ncbi:MAG: hypothetical protein IJ428_05765 [Clostridia bacterium]|nr:hypothetical protein [Clostridia bacterium]